MIHPKTLFQFKLLHREPHVLTWTVPETLPYFDGHFPKNPILPAIAVLDGTLEALKLLTGNRKLSFEKIRSAKFLTIVTPGTVLQICLTSVGGHEWEVEWTSPQKIVARLKFSLKVR